jgi:lipocalin
MSCFDINKYMGTWYELIHYPSWFERNDNYNNMAQYKLECDGTVTVHNSSISNGCKFDSYGTARSLGDTNFRVDFNMDEVKKLASSGQFTFDPNMIPRMDPNMPNYVIDCIWTNKCGEYIFAVVTDCNRNSLYVLSRYKRPSLIAYNEIMGYVIANYDRDRLVQVPHYE